jgi:hypothetical protein
MEHWLPLFYDRLETVFDHAGGMPVVFDHLVHEALTERHTMVVDHYEARLRQAEGKEAGSDAVPYKPVKPETLYLTPQAVEDAVQASGLRIDLTPFGAPEVSNRTIVHADAHKGRNFAEERAATDVNLFEAAVKHIADLRASGKKVLVAAWTEGSLDRLLQVLDEHGLEKIETVDRLSTVKALSRDKVTAAVLAVESGFDAGDLAVVAEQDILGDRLIRRSKRRKRDQDFISEVASLTAGDIVVHVDHGIGRFIGLKTITAAGAPHDCLELHYAGDDRLFLPVENIELLSRSRSRQLRWQSNQLLTNQTNLSSSFKTGALQHALSAGMELIYEKQTSRGRTGAGTVAPANLYDPRVDDPVTGQDIRYTGQVSEGNTKTLALYAFDSIEFSPQWQLNGGLRWDRYRSANDNTTAPNATTGAQTSTQLRSSGSLLSAKLGLVFKPVEYGSIYAGISTSQQPPGGSNFALSATEGNINHSSMDPSKATNLEVGTKWDILDRRLLLTGALFQTTVRNDLGTVDSVTGIVTQYGKKQVKGIELGAVGQITPAWNITAGLARMNTEVQQGTASQTGAHLNWSPRLSFTSWTTYRFGNGLTLGGGARYMDRMARLVSNSAVPAITNMPDAQSYWVYDAFMAYEVSKNLRLQLNVYNLADRKYVASLNNNGGRYMPGTARSARLVATLKF